MPPFCLNGFDKYQYAYSSLGSMKVNHSLNYMQNFFNHKLIFLFFIQ